eukprot:4794592-Pyramimonas_sp.AAC.1
MFRIVPSQPRTALPGRREHIPIYERCSIELICAVLDYDGHAASGWPCLERPQVPQQRPRDP